jgi:hypothetical protein
MSDSLPKPLPSITALRAHLKLLERGVNDARTRRVGPSEPVPAPALVARPSSAASQRTAPASFQMHARPSAASNGKPKARPKSGADFGQFFDGIQQRAAG